MRTRLGLIGLAAAALVACNKPSDFDGDGFTADVDCNDNDSAIHPDAAEVCDGVDNNCDNSIDGADADGALTFYGDQDADGYGGMDISVTQCDMPSGFVDNAEDCNDVNADINPDGAEVCDGADNDCDGLTDDEDDSVDTSGYSAFYSDADGDGYGNMDISVDACNAPSGYTDNAEDCDDTDATVSPESIWYSDVDGDGFGSETFSMQSCDMPSGYVDNTEDCDDTDAAINPDATEICDGGIDNDCDTLADDADDSIDTSSYNTFYSDGDSDGYGDDSMTVTQCALPSGYAAEGGDCDDSEALANPGGTEICDDGIDNDCSGDAPECGLLPVGSATDAAMTLSGSSSAGSNWGKYQGIEAGDFNNDGFTDIAVSDYSYNSYRGGVEFFYGPLSSSPSPVTLSANDSTYSYSAYNMAGLGDVDGDGADDLLVGAKYADNQTFQAGGAYIVSGPTSSGFYEDEMIAFASPGNWAETYSYLGEGVGSLGDMNGDGYDDFAVGADGYDGFGYSSGGAVFFYLGAASTSGTLDPQFALYGEASYMYMGGFRQIDGAGDVDGDG
ncbi:MAG: MopE-related protein, partial [Myxococcota bacterium]|nr:MopE-related protein [Myxococcota bacterium]